MFSFFKKKSPIGDKLYRKIVEFSRNKYFYEILRNEGKSMRRKLLQLL